MKDQPKRMRVPRLSGFFTIILSFATGRPIQSTRAAATPASTISSPARSRRWVMTAVPSEALQTRVSPASARPSCCPPASARVPCRVTTSRSASGRYSMVGMTALEGASPPTTSSPRCCLGHSVRCRFFRKRRPVFPQMLLLIHPAPTTNSSVTPRAHSCLDWRPAAIR